MEVFEAFFLVLFRELWLGVAVSELLTQDVTMSGLQTSELPSGLGCVQRCHANTFCVRESSRGVIWTDSDVLLLVSLTALLSLRVPKSLWPHC